MPTSISGPPPASFLVAAPFVAGAMLKPLALSMACDLAQLAVADQFDGAQVGGLVLAAVGDHEFPVGLLAGVDHGLGIGDGGGHGLFAEHVLAGLGRADGVLGVHAVGQGDVDGVDVFVVGDGVDSFVAVDVARGNAVLAAIFSALSRWPLTRAGDAAVFAISSRPGMKCCMEMLPRPTMQYPTLRSYCAAAGRGAWSAAAPARALVKLRRVIGVV